MAYYYESPKVLLENMTLFWPFNSTMPHEIKINAAARLIIYISVALYLLRHDTRILLLALIGLLLLAAYSKHTLRKIKSRPKPLTALYNNNVHKKIHTKSVPEDMFVESKAERMMNELQKSKSCRKSTKENPFANYLVGDPLDIDAACPYMDQKNEVDSNFNHNLMRNVDDLYDTQNSQRQFFSMPHHIPDTKAFALFLAGGKTPPPTCKETPKQCTGIRG
jgi:hypothetical protein